MLIKRKVCNFCKKQAKKIDFKDPILNNFMTDKGKILSPKITGACARHQRMLSRAIKKARSLALLPYVVR
ncbi:MAG: 30S ribosomal protein S18 [bacterium]|nr:30S ribosomal protein S18 [candidate division WOR-3 bacterium]MDH5684005.1 30S ribosomal protein S18 [candidate division WOR-3 bacterium]